MRLEDSHGSSSRQKCGTKLYDDFVEHVPGALKELESELRILNGNSNSPVTRNARTGWDPQGASSRLQGSLASLHADAKHLLKTIASSRKHVITSLPLYSVTQTQENVHGPTQLEVLHLLCCIPSGEMGTKLHQSRLPPMDTDRDFILFLKETYRRQRNILCWLTLRSVSKVMINRVRTLPRFLLQEIT